MRVTEATFLRSVAGSEQLPHDGLPQIAFSGRSNVGKSSLINALLNRKALAQTSGTPGKTRLLNFYLINRSFYFVDLPGYGFAKVSLAERRQWRGLIENHLRNNPALTGIVALIDSRIGPTELDLELLAWLDELRLPAIVIATKADKLSRQQQTEQLKSIQQKISHLPVREVMLFSARNGLGKAELWSWIKRFIENAKDSPVEQLAD